MLNGFTKQRLATVALGVCVFCIVTFPMWLATLWPVFVREKTIPEWLAERVATAVTLDAQRWILVAVLFIIALAGVLAMRTVFKKEQPSSALQVRIDEAASQVTWFSYFQSARRLQPHICLTLWNQDTHQIPIRSMRLSLLTANGEIDCGQPRYLTVDKVQPIENLVVPPRDKVSCFVQFYTTVDQAKDLRVHGLVLTIDPVSQPVEVIRFMADWNEAKQTLADLIPVKHERYPSAA